MTPSPTLSGDPLSLTLCCKRKDFRAQSFWARGCFVSTVGRDEETITSIAR